MQETGNVKSLAAGGGVRKRIVVILNVVQGRHHFWKILFISFQTPTFPPGSHVCYQCSVCYHHLLHVGTGKDHSSELKAALCVECHTVCRQYLTISQNFHV